MVLILFSLCLLTLSLLIQFAERYGEQDGFAASGGSQANAVSTRGAAGEAKTAGGAGGSRTGDDRFRFVGDDTGTHFGVAKEDQISQALLHKYIAYGRRTSYVTLAARARALRFHRLTSAALPAL